MKRANLAVELTSIVVRDLGGRAIASLGLAPDVPVRKCSPGEFAYSKDLHSGFAFVFTKCGQVTSMSIGKDTVRFTKVESWADRQKAADTLYVVDPKDMHRHRRRDLPSRRSEDPKTLLRRRLETFKRKKMAKCIPGTAAFMRLTNDAVRLIGRCTALMINLPTELDKRGVGQVLSVTSGHVRRLGGGLEDLQRAGLDYINNVEEFERRVAKGECGDTATERGWFTDCSHGRLMTEARDLLELCTKVRTWLDVDLPTRVKAHSR